MRSPTRCFGCPGHRSFTRRPGPTLVLTLLTATLGCRDDADSPTGPAPALDVAAAAAPLSFRQVSVGGFPGGSDYHACGVTTDDRATAGASTPGASWGSAVCTRGRRTAAIPAAPDRWPSWAGSAGDT